MALAEFLLVVLVAAIIFFISSLPLYWCVKLLGGKTTLLKTAFIFVVSGIIIAAIQVAFRWGGLIAFLVLIWIYHESFRLKWWKAFILWFLHGIVVFILFMLSLLFFVGLVKIII